VASGRRRLLPLAAGSAGGAHPRRPPMSMENQGQGAARPPTLSEGRSKRREYVSLVRRRIVSENRAMRCLSVLIITDDVRVVYDSTGVLLAWSAPIKHAEARSGDTNCGLV
jgi:hypothetical protein